VNDELETKRKEAVKMFCTQLSYPGETEENKDTQYWAEIRKSIGAATPKCPVVYYCRIKLNALQHMHPTGIADEA
jgi:hypothetical protein